MAMLDPTHVLNLHLLGQSAFFDLSSKAERKRSARELSRFFFGMQRALQPGVFVEAGAKDARVSLRMRELIPGARIVAFEANPYNYAKYSSELGHDQRQVEYLNMAISDRSGGVTFRVQRVVEGMPIDPISGRNSLLARTGHNVDYEEITVAGTSLDDFFSCNASDRFSLWIDVEGASGLVLRGGAEVLAKTDSVMIEVEQKRFWEDQWLAADVVRSLVNHGLVPVARDFEYKSQYNIVFINAEKLYDPVIQNHIEGFINRARYGAM